jgi:hypothetical protein
MERVAGFAPLESFSELGLGKNRAQCRELFAPALEAGGIFVDSGRAPRTAMVIEWDGEGRG